MEEILALHGSYQAGESMRRDEDLSHHRKALGDDHHIQQYVMSHGRSKNQPCSPEHSVLSSLPSCCCC